MGRLEGYLKYRRAKHSEKLRAKNLKSGKRRQKAGENGRYRFWRTK